MKTGNHTQGEWKVKKTESEEYENHFLFEVHATKLKDGKTTFRPFIADIHFGRTNEEREANAKLIAAAPNMAAQLRETFDRLAAFREEANLSEQNREIIIDIETGVLEAWRKATS